MPKPSPKLRPIFTVVIPCFEASETIATAIASVLAQSERNFELVVVDDGSQDGSVAAARAALGDDPRGRVLFQPNAGPAAARNYGVAAGSAPLLAFLDADDRWMPDLLAAHRTHFITEPDVAISFGRLRFYDAALRIPGRCSLHHAAVDLGQAMGENPCCSTSNLTVRRDVFTTLGGFDTGLTHAEDQEFVVRVVARTKYRVAGINRELVHYRMSPHGLSADLVRMEQGWDRMLAQAREYADPDAYRAAEPPARALFARYLARRALRTGQPATIALGHLWTGLRIDLVALFTREPRRTVLTAAGALAVMLLPRRLVQSLVAR